MSPCVTISPFHFAYPWKNAAFGQFAAFFHDLFPIPPFLGCFHPPSIRTRPRADHKEREERGRETDPKPQPGASLQTQAPYSKSQPKNSLVEEVAGAHRQLHKTVEYESPSGSGAWNQVHVALEVISQTSATHIPVSEL